MIQHRFVTTCIALIAITGTARAGIVVVSSGGTPAPSTSSGQHVIDEVLGLLAADGLTVDPAPMVAAAGASFPRPQRADLYLTAPALFDGMKRGVNAFIATNYADADKQLSGSIAQAHDNLALIVSDFSNRKLWLRAHVDLALARERLHDAARAELPMAELARSYPDRTSVLDDYGPEADVVFQRARKRLLAAGSGSLVVHVNDPNVLVFVDESDQPRNATFEENLLPGSYRILILDPSGNGRRYDVVVAPGQQTQLAVDWRRDLAVSVEPRRVDLAFASDPARTSEAAYVQSLARPLHAGVAIAIGEIVWKGHPAIIGTTYRVDTGEVARTGLVIVDGRDDDEAHVLSSFLAWGTQPRDPTLELVTLSAPPWSSGVALEARPRERSTMDWTDYTLGAVALATLGGGAYAAIGGSHPGLGYGSLAVGVVIGVVEIVRAVRGHGSEPAAAIAGTHAPNGGVACFGWTF